MNEIRNERETYIKLKKDILTLKKECICLRKNNLHQNMLDSAANGTIVLAATVFLFKNFLENPGVVEGSLPVVSGLLDYTFWSDFYRCRKKLNNAKEIEKELTLNGSDTESFLEETSNLSNYVRYKRRV